MVKSKILCAMVFGFLVSANVVAMEKSASENPKTVSLWERYFPRSKKLVMKAVVGGAVAVGVGFFAWWVVKGKKAEGGNYLAVRSCDPDLPNSEWICCTNQKRFGVLNSNQSNLSKDAPVGDAQMVDYVLQFLHCDDVPDDHVLHFTDLIRVDFDQCECTVSSIKDFNSHDYYDLLYGDYFYVVDYNLKKNSRSAGKCVSHNAIFVGIRAESVGGKLLMAAIERRRIERSIWKIGNKWV